MKIRNVRLLAAVAAVAAVVAAPLATAQDATPARAVPPAKDAAEMELRAIRTMMAAPPPKPLNQMTPLERAQIIENRDVEIRQRALGFISAYPQDPRRWNAVMMLNPTKPRFVLEWNTEPNARGQITPARTDEAAAAAWKARVEALQAEAKVAADLPDDVKQQLARMEQQAARAKLFAQWVTGTLKAPDFTNYTVDNKPVRLSKYKGKVVIVDFWASWCGPCKAAFPHVQELARKYKKQGVVVLASGTSDKRADFEKFVNENIDKYPDMIWSHDREERSENRVSASLYHVSGIPTQFIIDRKGTVVDTVVGYTPGDPRLEAALAKAGIKVPEEVLTKADAREKRGS